MESYTEFAIKILRYYFKKLVSQRSSFFDVPFVYVVPCEHYTLKGDVGIYNLIRL